MSKVLTRICMVTSAIGWLFVAAATQAEIYKTTDTNGNVVYTDQPPSDSAEPMKLPGLSVIEFVKAAPRQAMRPAPSAEEEVTSIRDLRRGYRDFAIVSPAPEETLWGTNNQAQIAWNTEYALQPGMKVILIIDGKPGDPTVQPAINLRLNRGAHTVSAELIDSRNRRIATADPVTFYIQQYSVNRGQGN